ncbi:hypothetical protein CEXT_238601 [Caerostris extrusa]|uniref:Uncharacterized protein n=1 Tax=Caerostris extrusa TaxID=172846 RepID=A0AAV4XNX8_CAEEX|nr:hypothetical protein CEXT_238601 [Caerostris extrusa]
MPTEPFAFGMRTLESKDKRNTQWSPDKRSSYHREKGSRSNCTHSRSLISHLNHPHVDLYIVSCKSISAVILASHSRSRRTLESNNLNIALGSKYPAITSHEFDTYFA